MFVTATYGETVSVNVPDCVPSMVSRNVEVAPAIVWVLPVSVSVPALLLITTLPETDTPAGRFTTDAEYEPLLMFAVVTGKVTEPEAPAVSAPDCAPTVTLFGGGTIKKSFHTGAC